METVTIYRANDRGHANHGWLNTYHTFNFADYYHAERTNFGVLRVLNDDTVAPGMGFGTHPHKNMEIISIPLEGDLEHKDSMGNLQVIKQGDVQVMSAGKGVFHSEYNHHNDKPVKFLQIWVMPRQKDVEPRYQQLTFNPAERVNKWQTIVSPDGAMGSVWVHQDAWFQLGKFTEGTAAEYKLQKSGNGVFVFVLQGKATVNGAALGLRDGVGITGAAQVTVSAGADSELLLMEVPLQLPLN